MKLTARDQDQQNALAHAYHGRERFTLTGAGLQAEFVAEVINRVPCVFGSGRYETNLELIQVTEATTQAAWNGEGLPTIGTVCELRAHKLTDWNMAKIEFAHRNIIVWDWIGEPSINGLCTAYAHNVEMRPIRTPEQIAAEEREKAVDEMVRIIQRADWNSDGDMVGALYDAGYRKV